MHLNFGVACPIVLLRFLISLFLLWVAILAVLIFFFISGTFRFGNQGEFGAMGFFLGFSYGSCLLGRVLIGIVRGILVLLVI